MTEIRHNVVIKATPEKFTRRLPHRKELKTGGVNIP
jgi:hypothetical protein